MRCPRRIPGLSIGNSIVPELDICYFFTQNIAAELMLVVTNIRSQAPEPERSPASTSEKRGCCRRH